MHVEHGVNLLYGSSFVYVYLDRSGVHVYIYRWIDKFIDSSQRGRERERERERQREKGERGGGKQKLIELPQKAINKFDTKVGKLAKLPRVARSC